MYLSDNMRVPSKNGNKKVVLVKTIGKDSQLCPKIEAKKMLG